ncbi:MAG: hypothetical protein GC155_13745 [Alphaproteobacteria bacterium]|nr:hypothetical protein [Alphaproteobacteria bacterium]
MSEPDHSKIIAQAAKAALGPIGFVRQGRSRLWLSDHGFWMRVVQFVPGRWSRDSYLQVAAHWLWTPMNFLSLDYMPSYNVRSFISVEDPTPFRQLAEEQAAQAADVSARLATELNSIEAVARVLRELVVELDNSPLSAGRASKGWLGFNLALLTAFSFLDLVVMDFSCFDD